MRAHTIDACRFEGKDIGGRVQTFSYEGHVCSQSTEQSVSFCTCSMAYEAGASIVFSKNYYVR